jgi:YVTN family beta-propeller protein
MVNLNLLKKIDKATHKKKLDKFIDSKFKRNINEVFKLHEKRIVMNICRFLALFIFGLFCASANMLLGAPVVTALHPNFGPVAGGNTVDIIGSGFTHATAVNFGSTPATSFVFVNDGFITAIAPEASIGTVTVSVTTPLGTSPISAGSYYAYQGSWSAYVTNSEDNSVTPINIATNTPGAPIPVGADPFRIVITPNDTTAYVINSDDNTVTPINIATNTPGTPITVGTTPLHIAITPNSTTAYVTNADTNNVTPINVATNTAGIFIPVGNSPSGITITPDGKTAYVANSGDNTVTPINIATNTPGTPIPVGTSPSVIAITPDGKTAYVVNTNSNDVTPITIATNTPGTPIPVGIVPFAIAITPDGKTAYVLNFDTNDVTPIDIATNTPGTPIPIGLSPNGIIITPDGTTAYVVNSGSNNVTPINTATNTAGAPIPVGGSPFGIAITPDSKTAYVVNFDTNNVTPIDIATNTPGTPIPVGTSPFDIAITADPAPIALFSTTVAPAGSATSFDASSSVTPVGSIVTYVWNFGDGHTLITHTPTTSHIYALAGSYSVTLTVTNSAGTSTTQTFTGQTASRNGGPSATTTQTVNLLPLPPSNFIGVVKKNKFLNKTEYVLKATWDASPSSNVVYYRIYKNSMLVDTVLATSPLVFETHLESKHSAKEYEIAAVLADNLESSHLKIKIVNENALVEKRE